MQKYSISDLSAGMLVKCALGVAAAILIAAPVHASPINVAGYSFSGSADSLIASTGSFTTSGGSLATVLTDLDPGTYAFSFSTGASVTLGFSGGIVNGAGADFVLFELGTPDTFTVTLNGTTLSFLSVATAFSAGGFTLNAAEIDLSAFGYGAGASINSVVIGLDTPNVGNATVPSLSFAGVLNSSAVPEPSSVALFGTGLAGLGLLFARKRG